MDLHQPRRAGYRVRAFLILTTVILLTVGGVLTGLDRVCYHYLNQRLPIYPDAEVRIRTHNFMTELGMGNTVITLYTADPPDDVRSWYAVQTGSLLREWARRWALPTRGWGRRSTWSSGRCQEFMMQLKNCRTNYCRSCQTSCSQNTFTGGMPCPLARMARSTEPPFSWS